MPVAICGAGDMHARFSRTCERAASAVCSGEFQQGTAVPEWNDLETQPVVIGEIGKTGLLQQAGQPLRAASQFRQWQSLP